MGGSRLDGVPLHPAGRRSLGSARLVAAWLSLAIGAAATTYGAVGDRSVDGPGLPRVLGPFRIPTGELRVGAVIAALLVVGGLAVLARHAARRQLGPGWWLVATGYGALGAISGWEWRELTAASFGSRTLLLVSAGVAVAAWIWLLTWSASSAWRAGRLAPPERGCSYCAQDVHLVHGDVQQLAVSEHHRLVLLRCPRCGWLYCASLPAGDSVTTVSEAQARETFPNTW